MPITHLYVQTKRHLFSCFWESFNLKNQKFSSKWLLLLLYVLGNPYKLSLYICSHVPSHTTHAQWTRAHVVPNPRSRTRSGYETVCTCVTKIFTQITWHGITTAIIPICTVPSIMRLLIQTGCIWIMMVLDWKKLMIACMLDLLRYQTTGMWLINYQFGLQT